MLRLAEGILLIIVHIIITVYSVKLIIYSSKIFRKHNSQAEFSLELVLFLECLSVYVFRCIMFYCCKTPKRLASFLLTRGARVQEAICKPRAE